MPELELAETQAKQRAMLSALGVAVASESPSSARGVAAQGGRGMSAGGLATAWARALVSGLLEGGVDHFFVSPGSRSTPLVLAVHVFAPVALRWWSTSAARRSPRSGSLAD